MKLSRVRRAVDRLRSRAALAYPGLGEQPRALPAGRVRFLAGVAGQEGGARGRVAASAVGAGHDGWMRECSMNVDTSVGRMRITRPKR